MDQLVQDWAAGKTTLKAIKGYTDDELHAIAQVGYYMLMQGKNEEAKTLFEGLTSVDPRNDYYHRALGVLYYKLGEAQKAIRQFAYAIRVNKRDPIAYVNRAEVYIAEQDWQHAISDIRTARTLVDAQNPALQKKIDALARVLARRMR